MKKRVLALMMAALFVFATACGSTENVGADTTVEEGTVEDEAVEEAEVVITDETTDADVATGETADEVAEDVVEEETDIEETASAGYYPGVFTETGYESEFLGFRYTTPEGFTIATEEEVEEMTEAGQELLNEDYSDLQMAYANIVTINELMVTDEYGLVNFNITLEKTGVDLETYITLFKEQIAGLTAMTIEIVNEEEVELAGATYTKLTAQVESQGYLMWQEYYLRKQDERVVALVTTWLDGMDAEKETMMSGFAAY